MSKKLLIIPFCILTTLIASATAQSLIGLTYPMGIPVQNSSSTSQSLGGTGVAIQNDFLGAANNPANLGTTQRTVFSTSIGSRLLILNDNGKKNYHLNTSLSTLSLSVPVSGFGTLAFSISPESDQNVRFQRVEPFDTKKSSFTESDLSLFLPDSVEVGILRSGNALSWQMAWGYTLPKKVSIGVAIRRFNFNQITSELINTHGSINNSLLDSTRISYHTNAIKGGIIIPVKQFSLGLSGDYYFINDAKISRIIAGTRADDTTRSGKTFELKPAPSLCGGASYQINQHWFTAADVRVDFWSRYHSDLSSSIAFEDALTLSAGVQYIPAPNLLSPKFYEITQYRAGLRYSQLPGPEGSEIALTLAAGVPMQANGGLIDVIVEMAQRNDTRFKNYSENIIGIRLGINAGRKWYQSGRVSY